MNCTEGRIIVSHNVTIENNILKGPIKDENLENDQFSDMILKKLDEKPDRFYQIDTATGKETTAAQLKESIIRCALWMTEHGIKPGDIVVICTYNHAENCIPILATFLVGATFSGWPDRCSLEYYRRLMGTYKPNVIFASRNTVNVLNKAAELENVQTNLVAFGQDSHIQTLSNVLASQADDKVKKFQPVKLDNPHEHLAYIGLSSGSSGFPKGIMHSYERITRNFATQNYGPKEIRFLSYSSPPWNQCLRNILHCALNNMTRIVHEYFEVEELGRIIEKFKVTRFRTIPTAMNYIVKSKVSERYNLDSLEEILIGGIKSNWKIYQELRKSFPKARVYSTIGMTELLRKYTIANPYTEIAHSIGFIAPNVQAKVIDLDTGKTLGPNECGELYLKVSTVTLGYYKNPEKTRETFDDEGWFHTGDIVYYREDGELFYVDRVSEVIKYRGHRLYPTEIEEALLDHPNIVEAAVVSVTYDKDREWPIAFVKLLPGHNVTEEELVELSPNIEGEKILRGKIVFLNEIPKTPSAKNDRQELKRQAGDLMSKKIEKSLLVS